MDFQPHAHLTITRKLTLVLLAVVPAVAVGAVMFGKRVKALSKAFQDALAVASSTAEEALGAMRTVRSFANDDKAAAQYGRDINGSYAVGKKFSFVMGAFAGVAAFLAQGAMVLVLW